MDSIKIQSFTDLNAWKKGHDLVLLIYKITDQFPQKEVFTLTSQMRRSVISITSNIAEGFSRRSLKEKVQFYPPSQKTMNVSSWMNAKSFPLRRDSAPDEARGEDTPGVSPWELHFMTIGSTTELQNQLIIAKDVGYISEIDFKRIHESTIVVHKLVNGLIKSIKAIY